MNLYDTARGAVHPLRSAAELSLYVCGITPYDSAHLGHAFVYHTFDVLTRRLTADGVRVRSVRNVTDVDDDILRVARERGVDYRQLVTDEVTQFDADMTAIHILPVDAAPMASEGVAAIVEWVDQFVTSGVAYCVDGWVYFSVQSFSTYGALSRLSRADMIALSRERGANPDDSRKRDALDFVLWQPSLADEPSWPSPWGDGRPGWHMECSVLSAQYCGFPLDIHGGGDDLIFPHHESERAQSETHFQSDPFARHWMHVGMVRYQGAKMSKSLGNLVFVGDLLRSVPGSVIRLLLASHHYRSSWEYNHGDVDEAAARDQRYRKVVSSTAGIDAATARRFSDDFFSYLDNDLDTVSALASVDFLCGELEKQPSGDGRGATTMRDSLMILGWHCND